MARPLVLASSSRYRRELLARLGLPFRWASPDVDETPLPEEPVAALVERLALAKATALAASFPDALLIGSDQACQVEGTSITLGKPGGFEPALTQLLACNGRQVCFHTAVTLLDARTGQRWQARDEYRVYFRRSSEAELRAYLLRETPYDCAGSFKAEGLGIALFSALEGRDFHSLVGLPLISLCELLRQAGVDPLTPA